MNIFRHKAILTHHMVGNYRPDITLVEKKAQKAVIINITNPNNSNLHRAIKAKKDKYSKFCFR